MEPDDFQITPTGIMVLLLAIAAISSMAGFFLCALVI
jgi:hypothetical protein